MTTLATEHAQRRGPGPSLAFPWEDRDQTIPGRFARIAERVPDQVAVLTPRQSLTYAELDLASDRLARRVLQCIRRGRAGGGDQTVALLLEEACR